MAGRRRLGLDDLPAAWAEELSDAALRDVAGMQSYERGLEYVRSDRLQLISAKALKARFEAHGSALYRVDLHFEDPGLHADCTCPHAEEGNFCKHMVAAALLWRQVLTGEPPAAAAAESGAKTTDTQARRAKAKQTRASNRQALQDFLARQPATRLAQRLWERAEQDRDLMAELKAWAATEGAADDPKTLRVAVDALLKVSARTYLERAEVRAWMGRALKAVALLRAALSAHAAEVRSMAENALPRCLGVQGRAVDIPGEVDEITAAFMGVVIDALQAAPPPAVWADTLLQRVQGELAGWWSRPEVLQAAGPEVARVYSRRLAEAWQRRPIEAKPGDAATAADLGFSGRPRSFDATRDRLRRLMLQDLERQGDPLAVFEFMKRSAQGLGEHAALIRWCNEHGRPRDALQLAQAACKLFDNHPAVEELLVQAYERDGWDDEVLAIRQTRFDAMPSPDNYGPLLAAARRAKADVQVIKRQAYALATAREQVEWERVQQQHALQVRRFGPHGGRPAPMGLNVSWRAGMHVLDGEADAALALVQPPRVCDPRVLEALADLLPPARDADAFVLLRRCFDFEMARAKTPYKEPLRLVAKAMARLNSQDARAWLLSLGNAHRARRNFIAGLPPYGNVALPLESIDVYVNVK